jgi:hypothetical protein
MERSAYKHDRTKVGSITSTVTTIVTKAPSGSAVPMQKNL